MKLCECGCGQETSLITEPNARLGWVRGEPRRFRVGHHNIKRQRNPKHYKQVQVGTHHPRASTKGSVYVHILVVEKALGKCLLWPAEVHHVDGNRQNNSHRNLVVCQDHDYHVLLHVRQRIRDAGGNPNTEKICNRCKTVKPLEAFGTIKDSLIGKRGECKECRITERARHRESRRRREAA